VAALKSRARRCEGRDRGAHALATLRWWLAAGGLLISTRAGADRRTPGLDRNRGSPSWIVRCSRNCPRRPFFWACWIYRPTISKRPIRSRSAFAARCRFISPDRLIIAPDCGLSTSSRGCLRQDEGHGRRRQDRRGELQINLQKVRVRHSACRRLSSRRSYNRDHRAGRKPGRQP